ncbi:MAG: hypothetical protein QM811_05905 [Pirellulales bacterium]
MFQVVPRLPRVVTPKASNVIPATTRITSSGTSRQKPALGGK